MRRNFTASAGWVLFAITLAALGFLLYFQAGPNILDKQFAGQPVMSEDIRVRSAVNLVNNDNSLQQKLIHTAYLELKVEEVIRAEERVQAIATQAAGYVSEVNTYQRPDGKNLRMVIRIPAEELNEVINGLLELGEVETRNISIQDITESYYDLDSRLNTKLEQEQRYLEILAQAERVEEVLQVERELERIRVEIESLQGRKRYMDDQVAMSTVTLNLREENPVVLGFSLGDTLRQATMALLGSVESMIILLGGAIPYLVLILLGLGLVRIFWPNKR